MFVKPLKCHLHVILTSPHNLDDPRDDSQRCSNLLKKCRRQGVDDTNKQNPLWQKGEFRKSSLSVSYIIQSIIYKWISKSEGSALVALHAASYVTERLPAVPSWFLSLYLKVEGHPDV